MLRSVKWSKSTVTISLALLWLAATVHCRLESLPGFEFLSCCTHADVKQSASHHETDCQTDACAMIESGCYKQEDSAAAPVNLGVTRALLDGGLAEFEPPITASTSSGVSAPPELSHGWQFSYRTALPPRAPSRVS